MRRVSLSSPTSSSRGISLVNSRDSSPIRKPGNTSPLVANKTNINHPNDANLTKQVIKMIDRIEKIIVPNNSLIVNSIGPRLDVLKSKLKRGVFYMDAETEFKQLGSGRKVLVKSANPTIESTFADRIVNWELLEEELCNVISNYDSSYVFPKAVIEEIETEKKIQFEVLEKFRIREKLSSLQNRNGQPIVPCKWRKEPYASRTYEKLDKYAPASGLSVAESEALLRQLDTSLNGFLGQAYNYDDQGLTEEWMVTFRDGSFEASEDVVIHTQIESLLELLTSQVQDKVLTENKVLEIPPIGLGESLKEAPVWGIDCYTRKMIELVIKDNINDANDNEIKHFVEKLLLPSINTQNPEKAHNMTFAADYILNNHQVSDRYRNFAFVLKREINDLGISDSFRIHPKGTGVICTNVNGIPPHVVIAEYLGELYPPYRWCEKLDVVQQAQEKYGLKPTLPDFYNILLERPRQDPSGYGMMFVDASQKANLGSSCSHSCDPNSTSAVVAKNGKLVIVLTTNRQVDYGEELTMDYYSVTSSDIEWRAAICLCGMTHCRGSFLHYATQDDLQQVLNQNCGPLWRYASLLRACSNKPLHAKDLEVLDRHGIKDASLIPSSRDRWILQYTADNLKFIEFERKALPCALLRAKDKITNLSLYTYSAADMEARSVMEQRIQSLICWLSMTQRVLMNQPQDNNCNPLRVLGAAESIQIIISRVLAPIPSLIKEHLNKVATEGSSKKTKRSKKDNTQDGETKDSSESLRQQTMQTAITTIERLLTRDIGSSQSILKDLILEVRNIILTLVSFSSSQARFQQLADILVLWAYTSNFSVANEYEPVKSKPVTVYARELGTNIPRLKIFKSESSSRRKSANGDLSSTGEYYPICDVIVDQSSESSSSSQQQVDVPLESIDEKVDFSVDANVSVNTCNEINTINTSSRKVSHKDSMLLLPHEPVYLESKVYDKNFIFWSSMGWFDAGTDNKIVYPDIFGCVELPLPFQCFGIAENAYNSKQRDILLKYLSNEKMHSKPWPNSLKTTFSFKNLETNEAMALYGSPSLDVALGRFNAIISCLQMLDNKRGDQEYNQSLNYDNSQFDNNLPPEQPTAWVQCENKTCCKWRRVAWNIDIEELPDNWVCSMNDWDSEFASCDAPQESFNPEKESTVEYRADKNDSILEVGIYKDVFCVVNKVYYEAQIKEIKLDGNNRKLIRFHFKGWSSNHDEWIEEDSDRIQPHHLYTAVQTSNAKRAEYYSNSKKNKQQNTKPKNSSSKRRKSSVSKALQTTDHDVDFVDVVTPVILQNKDSDNLASEEDSFQLFSNTEIEIENPQNDMNQ